MTDARAVILVNLRVVAKLQPGDRLQCTDSRYFGIDRGYWSFLWRWMKADGRALALERLEEIVREASAARDSPMMSQLLSDAANGINHLIETYHTDPTTVSRLEAILTSCNPELERAL